MKSVIPTFAFWFTWILVLAFIVWFAISLIIAGSGYESFRWM